MPKILIIDDEEKVRTLIQQALSLRGFQALAAPDGETGLKLARVHAPDLILCDVNMDGLNGYEVLEELRADPATHTLPFILMTGQADLGGMRQGMTLGADDYLAKPFQIAELYAAVTHRLQKQQLLREQADEKLASLRTNISMMLPHELLTPLTGILGASELIRSEAASLSAAQIAEFAGVIQRSGERLQRLIENFLIYAQIELLAADLTKVAALDHGPTKRTEICLADQAVKQAKAVDRAGDLRLALVPASVAISEEHLQKLFSELLDNAFKFSKPGTPIGITSTVLEQGLRLEISDQGRGIKSEDAVAVGAYVQFERKFYEQQGSGLGLIIAKRLVEIHRGQFAIDSGLNQGTRVRLTLPLA